MWAPPAASPAAAGATPSLRRLPSRAAAVRVFVAPPVAARTQQDQPRRRLCLAVPPPASEMASAGADGEEEEEEEEVVVVVEAETGRTEAVEMDAAVRRELAIRRLREEADADASEAGTGRGGAGGTSPCSRPPGATRSSRSRGLRPPRTASGIHTSLPLHLPGELALAFFLIYGESADLWRVLLEWT